MCSALILTLFTVAAAFAGVGGGIEAKEKVDIVSLVQWTLVFLAGLGTVFGVGLAIAAKRFAVEVDPRVEKVLDVLAACALRGLRVRRMRAVCRGSGQEPGCCTEPLYPAGAKGAEAVALITGKKADLREPIFARIMCQGSTSRSRKKFIYEGVMDCRAAVLAGGGDKSCANGCLGYGTCTRVCPFDALHMGTEGLPVVDITKCTGCRKCEQACPKKVIEVLPASKMVLVACHSRDKGGDTRKNCDLGCIACGACVKVCPFDAPSVQNNFSRSTQLSARSAASAYPSARQRPLLIFCQCVQRHSLPTNASAARSAQRSVLLMPLPVN